MLYSAVQFLLCFSVLFLAACDHSRVNTPSVAGSYAATDNPPGMMYSLLLSDCGAISIRWQQVGPASAEHTLIIPEASGLEGTWRVQNGLVVCSISQLINFGAPVPQDMFPPPYADEIFELRCDSEGVKLVWTREDGPMPQSRVAHKFIKR
jgi:hypothetical protein